MNLRKVFNFPTEQQKAHLDTDAAIVLERCKIVARKERDDMYKEQENHDNVCPNCKTKKSDNRNNIVNNIRRVKGDGNVGGNLFNVSGSISIDTYAVNHCNVCGNEWEKFKTKSVSETSILSVCLRYLIAILKDPNEKRYDWKMEAIGVFNEAYAETVHKLARKENYSYLTLSRLRKYYESIYDEKNRKELEKL